MASSPAAHNPQRPRCVVLGAQGERVSAIAAVLDPVMRVQVRSRLEAGDAPDLVLIVEPQSTSELGPLSSQLAGLPTVLMVAFAASGKPDAASFLSAGADDIVWLPLRGADEVMLRYLARSRTRSPHETSGELVPGIIARSETMLRVCDAVRRIAPGESTALLCGETGTGKELLARSIHSLSPRRDGPFIAVNLSAVPETLIESELFGHEPGAFTGATTRRAGRFEAACGGTLFLDEIGDLQSAVQVKLLRVLQEKVFERLGSTRSLRADFRLVCATHRNLEELVAEGKFREDLYYRIHVVRIDVPPLRERPEDAVLLAEHFLRRYCERDRKRITLAAATLETLTQHGWPGNVRELEHAIERGVALAHDGETLQPDIVAPRGERQSFQKRMQTLIDNGRGLDEVLSDIERTMIVETLGRYRGNQVHAARKLKIPRATLQNRMRRLGI